MVVSGHCFNPFMLAYIGQPSAYREFVFMLIKGTETHKKSRRIFVCTEKKKRGTGVCGGVYHDLNKLYTHSVSHTHEKTFECSECGKIYAQKCNLVRHVRTSH